MLPRASVRSWTSTRFGPFLAGGVLPFVLVVYLAFRGSGYDQVVRGEVGVAIWWVVPLGAIVGRVCTRRS